MMFLTTRAGYVPVSAITLIEYPDDDDFHKVHFDLGAGDRETFASALAVNALLDSDDA